MTTSFLFGRSWYAISHGFSDGFLSRCARDRTHETGATRSVERSFRLVEQVLSLFLGSRTEPDHWVKAEDMKTKNRSLFSRMCKCYGKKSGPHAQTQQASALPEVYDEVNSMVTCVRSLGHSPWPRFMPWNRVGDRICACLGVCCFISNDFTREFI